MYGLTDIVDRRSAYEICRCPQSSVKYGHNIIYDMYDIILRIQYP